jgi:hypothetical protein
MKEREPSVAASTASTGAKARFPFQLDAALKRRSSTVLHWIVEVPQILIISPLTLARPWKSGPFRAASWGEKMRALAAVVVFPIWNRISIRVMVITLDLL